MLQLHFMSFPNLNHVTPQVLLQLIEWKFPISLCRELKFAGLGSTPWVGYVHRICQSMDLLTTTTWLWQQYRGLKFIWTPSTLFKRRIQWFIYYTLIHDRSEVLQEWYIRVGWCWDCCKITLSWSLQEGLGNLERGRRVYYNKFIDPIYFFHFCSSRRNCCIQC